MVVFALITALLVAKKIGKASAHPTGDYAGTSPNIGHCVDFNLPITATAENHVYDYKKINNNIDATSWVIDYDGRTSLPPVERVIRNITVSGTYNIHAQLCIPKHGNKKTNLHIATHGAGFDKRYWNVRINPSEYSYVDAVLSAGYSILTYDRLGTGHSDKPDAYTVVQLPLEADILRGITEKARSGEVLDLAVRKAGKHSDIKKLSPKHFNKYIHIGHSLGSVTTTNFLSNHGVLSDAAIITGLVITTQKQSPKTAGNDFQFARQNNPVLFKEFGSGFIVPGTKSGLQTGFLSTKRNTTLGLGGFEPELLEYGNSIKQPLAVGEMESILAGNFSPAVEFKGPIQYFNGEYDNLLCGGDCKELIDEKFLSNLYPSSNFTSYIQPGTGHGLTMHRGANAGYKVMLNWLDSHGL